MVIPWSPQQKERSVDVPFLGPGVVAIFHSATQAAQHIVRKSTASYLITMDLQVVNRAFRPPNPWDIHSIAQHCAFSHKENTIYIEYVDKNWEGCNNNFGILSV